MPYWQDVTDVSGFSQYFLFRHSFKPHLPTSALATGVSDLLPAWQKIKLTTPFAREASYDFRSPRALALGQFDLAFVVAYLLPIVLILGLIFPATVERDHGALRLAAAQSASPRRWLHPRLLALLTLQLTGICVALLSALALAGVPLIDAGAEVAATLGVVVAYAAFWAALVYLVLTRWPHGWTAVGTMVALWALLVIAMPLLTNQLLMERAASAAASVVDLRRQVDRRIDAERAAIVRAAFEASPELAPHVDEAGSIDYSTRLSFLTPAIERALESDWLSSQAQKSRASRYARLQSLLIPSLGIQSSLATLAGTDLERHRDFEARTREFQLELRSMFYPLMHAQIVRPTPRPHEDSAGRFSFTDYDAIPVFRNSVYERDASLRDAWVQGLAAFALALGLVTIGALRLRRWPEDL